MSYPYPPAPSDTSRRCWARRLLTAAFTIGVIDGHDLIELAAYPLERELPQVSSRRIAEALDGAADAVRCTEPAKQRAWQRFREALHWLAVDDGAPEASAVLAGQRRASLRMAGLNEDGSVPSALHARLRWPG